MVTPAAVSNPPTAAAGSAAAAGPIVTTDPPGLRLPFTPAVHPAAAGAQALHRGTGLPGGAGSAAPPPMPVSPYDLDRLLCEIDWLEEVGLLTGLEARIRRRKAVTDRRAWLEDLVAWMEATGC